MEKKEFDVVEVVRRIRDAQFEDRKGKSQQEILKYYHDQFVRLEQRVHKKEQDLSPYRR
ncbi:MAG: hypothetical protein V1799_15360 [bacterium]